MISALKVLFGSKKFIVFVSGLIGALLAKYGLNVDDTTIQWILGLAATYILGQGIADHGKEAAKIEAGKE